MPALRAFKEVSDPCYIVITVGTNKMDHTGIIGHEKEYFKRNRIIQYTYMFVEAPLHLLQPVFVTGQAVGFSQMAGLPFTDSTDHEKKGKKEQRKPQRTH